MYFSIAVKLAVAMMGVLFFLRLSGKTQMAQSTPVNTVNAFVLGAMIGGVIYTPDLSVWYLIYAMAIWSVINALINYMSRFHWGQRLINGKVEEIIKDDKLNLDAMNRNHLNLDLLRSMLREKDIFSLLDVAELRLETSGQTSVSPYKQTPDTFLFINNGDVQEDALKQAKRSKKWLLDELNRAGIHQPGRLFGAEWTEGRGFYTADKEGKIKRYYFRRRRRRN